jgi:predicted ArsR family transcriptional regulator
MAWWQRQVGKTTKSRIVALLRRDQRSVEELAESLGVTDNAVRAQLAVLEREKIVTTAGIRRDGAVGKPATLYGIATDSSALFSSAYAPVLAALLTELGAKLTSKELATLLRKTGRRIAKSLPVKSTFDDRVKASAAFLASLGADAELVQTRDGSEIRGHGCVLSDAVIACPATCEVLEAVLRDVTGGAVRECCDRVNMPSCRFAISAPA